MCAAIAAPKMLIYDNGCNAHCYLINREPAFFESTSVYIDRLHMYVVTRIIAVTQPDRC